MYLALKDAEFKKIFTILARLNIKFLLLSVCFFCLSSFLKWYKWHFLVKYLKNDISLTQTIAPFCIGFGLSNILPLKVGEVARIYFLGKKTGIKSSATIATLVAERIIDGVGLIIVLLPTVADPFMPKWARNMVIFFIGLISIFLVVIYLLIFSHKRIMEKLERKLSNKIIRAAKKIIEDMYLAFSFFKNKKKLLFAVAISGLTWCLQAGVFLFLARAFEISLAPISSIFVMGMLDIALFIPTSPGSIGTFEFMTVKLLSLYSVERQVSISYSLVLHFLLFFPFILSGLLFFLKEGISLTQITLSEKS